MTNENNKFPKLDLSMFFLSISSSAMSGLGVSFYGEKEDDGKINLEVARQNIELLQLMKDKTTGNRTSEEDQLLEKLLFELQIKYVEVEKNVKN
jgi:hypothetical protein